MQFSTRRAVPRTRLHGLNAINTAGAAQGAAAGSSFGPWGAAIGAAIGAFSGGGKGGASPAGADGGMPMPGITVSPTLQTQISPQISPVFQQQFQPQNSALTAGTSQYMPTSQSAPQASQPGAMVPAGGSPVPGTADMPSLPTDMAFPSPPGSSGVYASGQTPLQKYGLYIALGIGAIIFIVMMKKRNKTIGSHRARLANKLDE